MKKILLLLFGAAVLFTACEKESLGVSKVTSYPVITLNGDEALTILVGGSYTELGCVSMEGDVDITDDVVIEGSVDVNTPGVYTISYTSVNVDGYSSMARRYIGVITPAAAAMDISGVYKRNAGALGEATVLKSDVYPGLYYNNNPGGVDLTDENNSPINIYMFHWDAAVVGAPSQDSEAGEFACTNGLYDDVSKFYSWKCVNAGYGTAIRTFNKL